MISTCKVKIPVEVEITFEYYAAEKETGSPETLSILYYTMQSIHEQVLFNHCHDYVEECKKELNNEI